MQVLLKTPLSLCSLTCVVFRCESGTSLCSHTTLRWKTVGPPNDSPEGTLKKPEDILNMHTQLLSVVWLFATLWTVGHQAPLSMGFFRQEYWSGLPCPPPGDLPDPGMEPASPSLADGFFTTEPSGKPISSIWGSHKLLSFLHNAEWETSTLTWRQEN